MESITMPIFPETLRAPPSFITPTPRRDVASAPNDMFFPTPHAFPVNWLCSTCGATHSVLEILTHDADSDSGEVSPASGVNCACDNPTLQAVYDQHGQIFLYWRNDPAILDLRDPARVREAAWRVGQACGGGDWLRDVLSLRAFERIGSRLS